MCSSDLYTYTAHISLAMTDTLKSSIADIISKCDDATAMMQVRIDKSMSMIAKQREAIADLHRVKSDMSIEIDSLKSQLEVKDEQIYDLNKKLEKYKDANFNIKKRFAELKVGLDAYEIKRDEIKPFNKDIRNIKVKLSRLILNRGFRC